MVYIDSKEAGGFRNARIEYRMTKAGMAYFTFFDTSYSAFSAFSTRLRFRVDNGDIIDQDCLHGGCVPLICAKDNHCRVSVASGTGAKLLALMTTGRSLTFDMVVNSPNYIHIAPPVTLSLDGFNEAVEAAREKLR